MINSKIKAIETEHGELIEFPVGPGEYASGKFIRATDKKTHINVKYKRFLTPNQPEVCLPDGTWEKVKKEDYFGAWG